MTMPSLAQPLGGWFKPADRVGHLVAFLRVHEITTEWNDLSKAYRDVYVVDFVDLSEGGPGAVAQRRVKVAHPGIAGRLDVENKSVVLGVIGQGEKKSRDMDAAWILTGHSAEQGQWFTESWLKPYYASLAAAGQAMTAQPAQRTAAPDPAPQAPAGPPQQQYQQGWTPPPGGAPQQYQQAPQQAPAQAPQQAPWGAGTPAPVAPAPAAAPPVGAAPQHAWPAGAVPAAAAPAAASPTPGAPPAGQAPAGYAGPPPGFDPATADPGTAALAQQLWGARAAVPTGLGGVPAGVGGA